MQHEEELIGFTSWQEKVNELARRFCQDENDRRLVNIETYSLESKDWDSRRLSPCGEFGEWVDVDDFRALAERFLLAIELIRVMEENQELREKCEKDQ